MKTMKKILAVIFLILVVLLSTLLVVVPFARAEYTQLQRRIGPPQHTPTCQETLDALRRSMSRTSLDEAALARQVGDTNAMNAFQRRAEMVLSTPDLKASTETCDPGNIKTLQVIDAQWKYQYVIDQMSVKE